ncbi:glutaminyl-peptide cyclotransferase [Flagellatimonas centrodinii]|uniref:glutaminyl-peptide cyclotransferase n=1 Tax=Flagellatimonas centrodinii TaxID=2806210 RepID=UPI001FEE5776|nr:glutaminyl-peptide cyclotransferase [Flagellatimonas centrodinii]ULQ45408.1 glutaminyl-peptide cyclotransferase [Flagellatimonas centrodinii]
MRILIALILTLSNPVPTASAAAPTRAYSIVESHPHDVRDFTQGLVLHDDTLIESTGGYGTSQLHFSTIDGTRVKPSIPIGNRFFGEGITVLRERLWQLTWRAGVGFVYDLDGEREKSFAIGGEGWGLTTDGAQLFMSDGSELLRRLDPESGQPIGAVRVRDGDRPVTRLNELEFIDGKLFANVWMTDRIAIIDPQSGQVESWLDLSELRARFEPPPDFREREHVLNGIAWDARRGLLLVTGKCWPRLFVLRIDGFGPPLHPAVR